MIKKIKLVNGGVKIATKEKNEKIVSTISRTIAFERNLLNSQFVM